MNYIQFLCGIFPTFKEKVYNMSLVLVRIFHYYEYFEPSTLHQSCVETEHYSNLRNIAR